MAEEMEQKRRVSPWVWIPGVILGGLLALLLVAYVLVRTGAFNGMIAGILEDALSDPATDTVAKVESFSGDPLSDFSIGRLTLTTAGETFVDLRGARAEWSHLGLLGGNVRIDRVHADSLFVAQPPPTDTEDTGPLLPNLPVDLRIERLKIDNVRFEDEETPFTLVAAGRWNDGPAIELRVALAPQEAQGEYIRLAADYDHPREELTLQGALQTKSGGGLGNFLFPGESGNISLQLSGDGTIENWLGALEGKRDGEQIADLRIEIKDRALIAGTLDPRPFLPKNETTALIGKPSITVEIGLEDGMPSSYDATILNPGAEIRISGTMEDGDAMMSPQFAIRSRNASWFAALLGDWRYDSAAVNGQVETDGSSRSVTADVRLDGLSGTDLKARNIRGNLELSQADADAAYDIAGTGAVEGLDTGDRTLRADWRLDASYDTQAGRIRIAEARISDAGSSIAASGDVTLEPLAIDGELSADIADIGRWLEAGSGRVQAQADIDWRPDQGRMMVRANGSASGLTLSDPQLSELVGSSPSFTIDMDDPAGSGQGVLKGSVEGAQVSASIDGRIGDTIDADFQARFADVAALAGEALEAEGPLTVTGSLNGRTASPDVELRTALDQAAYGDVQLRDVRVEVTARDVVERPTGQARASLTMDGEQVEADIPFETAEDGSWRADPIRISGKTIALNGQVGAEGLGAPMTGTLKGKISGKPLLTALAGMPAAGELDIDVALEPEGDAQRVTMDVAATDLSVRPTEEDTISAPTAQLRGDVVIGDALDIRQISLESGTLTVNRAKLTELDLSVSPSGDGLELVASTKGEYEGPLSVTLRARADRPVLAAPNTITLESLDGTVAGQKIALSSPATVSMTEQGTDVGPIRLTYNDAPIEAQALIREGTARARLSMQDVDLAALSLLTGGLKVQGKLSVDADVNLDETPSGDFNIEVADLVVEDTLDQERVDFQVTGTLRDNRLNGELRIRSGDERTLAVNADLPVTRGDGPFALQVNEQAPLDVAVKGNLDLGEIWPLTGAYEHILDGRATVDATVAGSIESPTLNGEFSIAGLSYRSLSTGMRVEAQEVRFTLDDNLLKLPQTSATDGKGGSITLSGWVKPLAPEGMEANIEVAFDKARVLNQRNMSAKATGNIKYVQEAGHAEVSGEATVNEAEYSLAAAPADDVIKLNVKELHRPPGLIELPEKPEPSDFVTRLKIDIRAQNQLFVRGRGLDSEWSGRLRVRGTVQNPSLQGRVELVRGRFDFAGRKFELADGSHIELIGGGDIDPVLNVRAVYSTSSLNAEIAISGRASNPQIKLSSNPEMPQDEIISRVLFGDSTQNLSAFEAAQLGAAVASLSSSGGGGLDVLGTLRNAFSLDRLTVGTRDEVGEDDDEGGGPVIRGGKYLTKNIYVEFGSATEEADATSASVDIDITDNLSVGTEATSTGNQKFKVEYKLDY